MKTKQRPSTRHVVEAAIAAAVAKKLHRNSISVDIRDSQMDLIRRRLNEADGYLDLGT